MDNIDNYDKATNLLFEYEKLYFTSPDEALKKMVDLYPIADEAFNHTVTDAIHLWLLDHISPDVKSYIRDILPKEGDSDFRKIYSAWLNWRS